MQAPFFCRLAALLAGVTGVAPAYAVSFTNILGTTVEFPAGAISFADELVDFSPGIIFDPARGLDIPLAPYLDGNNVLGPPDMDLLQSLNCFDGTPTVEDCKFASLGSLGSLTVRFTDNLLTGDGSASPDLWIFEAGPADLTFVDISTDGIGWSGVGSIDGYTGVDLDAFGFGPGSTFAYVRLRDAPGGQPTGDTLGADIDAIGAITTVPLPTAGLLLLSALLGVAGRQWAITVPYDRDPV
ncbi:MAG: PEP-CTERM sorting domain-containing protein [Gammaproteobacteria bacterium]|nr:PEP-CTERM sorting domain-containing protein [Gammaproteobacteria bacterium]